MKIRPTGFADANLCRQFERETARQGKKPGAALEEALKMWLRDGFDRAVWPNLCRRVVKWANTQDDAGILVTGHHYLEAMERFEPGARAEELAKRGWELPP